MVTKEFTFKGKTLQEIQAMQPVELAVLLESRARRRLKHGFGEKEKKLLAKMELAKAGKFKKRIRTHLRDMIILPSMFGLTVYIHNGKEFLPVLIEPDMLGHKLGEFVMTRKPVAHHAPGIGATKSSKAVSVK